MNFFEAQDRARKKTRLLIPLFIVAIVVLVICTNFVLFLILYFGGIYDDFSIFWIFDVSTGALQDHDYWKIFVVIAIGVCLLVITGSLIKMVNLSGGGPIVAEMLGGRPIPQDTSDPRLRKLMNVVEEMAIAAGTPIPAVYLLEDSSINAFAAGRTPADAVIGVTMGTITRLNRDEIQGVIAHEFSHILNGDMLLNFRLTGLLHGIVLLGTSGYHLLHHDKYRKDEVNSRNFLTAILGIVYFLAGYIGTILGQWIKAAVGRQREYLADASAVQFTRNKDGILGALKNIGGLNAGSFIDSPAAPEYSHAYFADGISSIWQSLHATHPPLADRIRKIDPYWDGTYLESAVDQSAPSVEPAATNAETGARRAATAEFLSSAEQAISQVGTINEDNVEYVHHLILAIPELLRNAAQSAYSARAVVYVLLIRQQENQTQAWALLTQHADKRMTELAMELYDASENLDERFKLPLLDLCINALRDLSTNQYIEFERSIEKIIQLDNRVDLNEWVLQRLVLQQLDEYFNFRKPAKAKHSSLDAVKDSAQILLSLIAHVEHKGDAPARQAFDEAIRKLDVHGLNLTSKKELTLGRLNKSLDDLMQLKPLVKPSILKACVEIILANGKATARGIELVRTISSCLDCPMPPMSAQSDQ